MNYTIVQGDHRSVRPAFVEQTLQEVLNRRERAQVARGELVAEDLTTGHLLSETSPLPLGTVVHLRAPEPARDLQGIGVVVNDAGEITDVTEAARIRLVELAQKRSFASLSLAEIRRLVEGSFSQAAARPARTLVWEERFPALARRHSRAAIAAYKRELSQQPDPILRTA